ncbi:hypothetical protein CTI12_AA047460 [Artemisia annua]|uniref:Uncharacterized protein n=1 Tax=Artemisia annua TaxID=35608 RepID=A0A2U1QCG6_ARTAN|nr:hypothetical protein CTI12_AA047460 [Artemisia annua]
MIGRKIINAFLGTTPLSTSKSHLISVQTTWTCQPQASNGGPAASSAGASKADGMLFSNKKIFKRPESHLLQVPSYYVVKEIFKEKDHEILQARGQHVTCGNTFCRTAIADGFVMVRYQMVEKPRAKQLIDENEIRITSQGRMRSYITYAMALLQVASLLLIHNVVVWGSLRQHRRCIILSKKLKFVEVDSMVKTSIALKDVQPELDKRRQKAVSKGKAMFDLLAAA